MHLNYHFIYKFRSFVFRSGVHSRSHVEQTRFERNFHLSQLPQSLPVRMREQEVAGADGNAKYSTFLLDYVLRRYVFMK